MKTEAQYTRDVLKECRDLAPRAVVRKINDRTTAGIPDAFVCHKGCTTWLEFKRSLSPNPRIDSLLTPAQKKTLVGMVDAECQAWVLVRTPDRWQVYHPTLGFVLDLSASPREVALWLMS